MRSDDITTVQNLRTDLALQIARFARRTGVTQLCASKQLGVPQPTLSKIMNGRTSQLSLELMIRIAVRAGLSLALQTGRCPEEAGAHLVTRASPSSRTAPSKLADGAREALKDSERRLTPAERLEAFLEHNQLMAELRNAGRHSEKKR
jgi:predicted XRE-type DNA-binding protein